MKETIMTVSTDNQTDEVDETTSAADENASEAAVSAPTADADGAETEPDPDPDEHHPDADVTDLDDQTRLQRPWARRVLAGVLVLLFVAALGISGTLGWMLWQQRELVRAGQQAQAAAVAYAQVLTSIDSNKVDENFNQVLDGATGEFKDMYSQSSTQLRQLLIDNKASAHGVVVESAIQSEAKNKVVVLLFVDQSVSNTNVPDPRVDRSRIKMTMEFVDGRWRASQVALP
jgi:Mce-associated membrane protein